MAIERAYLDHNASAPLLPAARAAMEAALDIEANASSVHAEGRAGRALVEAARAEIAALAGAEPENVVFTSGATEAATTLLSPWWKEARAPFFASRLYVCAADHPCVLNGGRFAAEDVEQLPVGVDGLIDLATLESALAAHDYGAGRPLVAIHIANNETGVIQPVREIGELARAAGAILVLDAVQAAGRIPIDISDACADFLILSSHKIGGPKGAGAIIAASQRAKPVPLVTGGGQEMGHRAGTENVAAIAGFGAAARQAKAGPGRMAEVTAMRDRLEATLAELAPDALFFGRQAPRLANTSFFAIPGFRAETAQIAFDLAGVALSAGSACSSGKVGPSHVLAAMGHGEEASALRVSIGTATGEAEMALFRAALADIVRRRTLKARAA